MKNLTKIDLTLVSGGRKVCYCTKAGGTSLPSRKPTSPEGCKHYCCNIIHFDIVSWTYVRDGIRSDGNCPSGNKPTPSTHIADNPISGPEFPYLSSNTDL